jgi:NADPH:quinone reductase-like Zn-dependent oxidoreductase
MSKMRVVQVTRPNGSFAIVEREIPDPGAGQVRIKVEACGICHSDSMTKEGLRPGIQYPGVPGHEIAGIVDEVAEGVAGWCRHTCTVFRRRTERLFPRWRARSLPRPAANMSKHRSPKAFECTMARHSWRRSCAV